MDWLNVMAWQLRVTWLNVKQWKCENDAWHSAWSCPKMSHNFKSEQYSNRKRGGVDICHRCSLRSHPWKMRHYDFVFNHEPLCKALELRGHVSSILFFRASAVSLLKSDTAKIFISEGLLLLSLFYSLFVSKLHNEPQWKTTGENASLVFSANSDSILLLDGSAQIAEFSLGFRRLFVCRVSCIQVWGFGCIVDAFLCRKVVKARWLKNTPKSLIFVFLSSLLTICTFKKVMGKKHETFSCQISTTVFGTAIFWIYEKIKTNDIPQVTWNSARNTSIWKVCDEISSSATAVVCSAR